MNKTVGTFVNKRTGRPVVFLTVYFEDLQRDTKGTLRQIMEFLGGC